uniref:Autotransporter adhesin BadA n=1 Tax=Bartonella henselae TaxID=38323 RepID=BADA_BARHN|nr:RecName: Full=Autotransporter adhesin BadA; AltName: Full=Bartonella adhesin A; Short=BadA; AltName: Full=Non-fimbrial adhesin A; AltName: Full=Type 5 secretion system autotransporter BadA; AltName: Full=Type IV pilus; Flags: Precursor [Bartonella henselae]AAT69970.2 adhesin A [Bartonella henselae]
MKKLSVTSKRQYNLYASPISRRLSLLMKLSLETVTVMFLLGASPVLASNLALTGAKNLSQNSPGVNYSKGSHGSIVLSGDDDFCGADYVLGRGGNSTVRNGIPISVEEEYERFVKQKLMNNATSPYSQSSEQQVWTGDGLTSKGSGYMGGKSTDGDKNILPEAYGIYSFATGCGSSAQGNYSVAFGANATALTGGSQAFGVAALASGRVSVAIGVGSEATGEAGVSLGGLSKAAGARSVAIGTRAKAQGEESIAIGSSVKNGDKDGSAVAQGAKAIAIGSNSISFQHYAVAVGAKAHALLSKTVALGYDSVADVDAGIRGYDPVEDEPSKDVSFVWKSSLGAVSVGNRKEGLTRQIIGVAAGTEDTDAVNVAQLKALRGMISEKGGWNLTVNNDNNTVVSSGGALDLSSGSKNLKIVKDGKKNNVTFDVARDLTLKSIKLDGVTLNETGLFIANGPQITASGINAGSQKITGVAEGTDANDAVNFGQLKKIETEVKEQVAASGFVKQDSDTKYLTIGKDTDGDTINIANNKSDKRTLTGIKEGDISKDSSEAITGSQLFTTNQNVKTVSDNLQTAATNIAKTFGGGAKYEDGEWIAPAFKVKTVTGEGKEEEKRYQNVADALAGVGSSITNVQNKVTEQVNNAITKVEGDALLWSDEANAFVARHEKSKLGKGASKATQENSKITYLLDGDVSKDSTDAITGKQLYSLGDKIASYLGGNAKYEDGEWTAPTFKVKTVKEDGKEEEKTYQNVAEALTGVGTSFTNVKNEITKQINHLQSDDSAVVHYDKNKDETGGINYASVTLGKGKDSAAVTLHNVADGSISKDSRDAINGSQIYSLNEQLATYFGGGAKYENGQWTAPIFKVKTVKEDGEEEEKTYQNVAEALTGVGTSFTNIKSEITKQIANEISSVTGDSLVKKDLATNLITIGKEVAGTEINIASVSKADRTLSGVKEAVKDNEAVNKGQLDKGLKHLSDSLQSDDSAVVHYDKKTDETGGINYTSVTLGGKDKTPVALHNVADGSISKDSHDAINGGQIHTIGEDVAKFLGGAASFNNGAFTGPTYKLSNIDAKGDVQQSEFKDIGSAFAGLDTNIKNVNNNVTNKFNELTQNITNVTQQVKGDALLWSDEANAFVARHEKSKLGKGASKATQENSKITYLLDGDVSKDSTDAITGKQLYSLGDKIASYLGGNAKYENGEWTAPTFKVKTVKEDGKEEEKTYQNVAEALTGVGASFTNVKNEITKQINHLQSDDSAVVHYDKNKDETGGINYASVTLGKGKDSAAVTLHNVADGSISKDSRDAINGSQIYSLNEQLATYFGGGAKYENGQWTAPIFKVKTVKEDGEEEEKTYQNVAEALTGVGTSFTNIKSEITKQIANEISSVTGDSLVKKDLATNLITIGKEVAGTEINIASVSKADRTLSGVKEAVKDNEAVNKGQLDTNIKKVEDKLTEAVGKVTQQVKGDALLWSNEDNAFVADHGKDSAKTKSKITHLLDGNIASGSTDAVTGGQLYSLNEQLATYFGGGAKYENGQWTAPTFKVKTVNGEGKEEEQTYQNVAEALTGVGASFMNVQNKITNEITNQVNNAITKVEGDSLVKQDNLGIITLGKERGGLKVDFANRDGLDRTLSGVKEAVNDNEAVNKGQLDADISKVNNNVTNKFNELTQNITNVTQQVKGDALLWSDEANAFVARHEKSKLEKGVSKATQENSKITYLLDGDISKGSTDAVTGGQLYSLNEQLATYFGGGAKYENGQWTAPTFKVKTVNGEGKEEEQTYQNVAAAFEGVGTSFTNIKSEITKQINNEIINVKGDSLVKRDLATNLITIGKEIEGSVINIANKSGEARTISGVKEAVKDNEAVNKGQLDTNIKKVEDKLTEAVGKVTQQVKGDALLWSNEDNAFVADHGKDSAKTKSKITHLLDGNIASGSTDAVTGGQLYSLNEQLATYFGGGAKYENGQWTAPTFKVKTVNGEGKEEEKTYQNVAAAFEGVGTSFTNIKSEITKQIANEISNVTGDSLVKKDLDTNLITIGKEIAGTEINIASVSKADRTLSGVKEAVNDNEAVNKGQLDANISKVNNNVTNKFNELTQSITNVTQQVKGDALLWSDEANAFVARHEKSKLEKGVSKATQENSKITYLLDGDISKGSTDAVTGGQLYSLNEQLATYFGGGAKYENGQWTAPTFKVKTVNGEGKEEEQTYQNVAAAFEGVGTSFTNIKSEITKQINNEIINVKGDSLVKRDLATNLITIGKEIEGSVINIANKSGEARTISGVKEAVKDNEAVNKGQLDTNIKKVEDKLTEAVGKVTQQVKGDALLWSNEDNAFVADHGKDSAKTKSKITHLLDGNIASGSTDAVTGGQLYSLNEQLATYFGGGAKYENGQWTAPTFKVKTVNGEGKEEEKTYQNVAAAFEGVGTSFTHVKNEITKQINHLQSDDSAVVHYDKDDKNGSINYASVTLGKGKDSAAVALHNVADGSISKDSHDAINGGQIHTIGEDVAKFLGGDAAFKDGAFTGPTYKLSNIDAKGDVQQSEFKDIGSAFAGLDTNIKNVNNNVTNKLSELTQNITTVTQQVKGNALLWSDEANAFVARHEKSKLEKGASKAIQENSKITYLLDGDVSKGSTDAVTGGQLYSMSNMLATYLGGNAKYENGEWTAPTFKVKTVNGEGKEEEQTYQNVAEALTGVGTSFTNIKSEIAKQINHLQSDDSAVIHYDKNKDETGTINYASVTLGKGEDSAAVALHNVAAGNIAKDSRDAINGSQLYSLNEQLLTYFGGDAGYKDGQWIAPKFHVLQFKSDGSSGEKESYDNVAAAFEGVNKSLAGMNERINNVTAGQNVSSSSLNWNETEGGYDARHNGVDSKLTHVENGDVSEKSKEAVNGSQLWNTNEKVEAVEKDVKNIEKKVQDIATVADSAVKYEKDSTGKKTNVIKLVGGSESEPVLIDNVADGKIEADSKQAVNGGQLRDYTEKQMKIVLDDAKKYTDERFNDVVNNGINEAKAYTDVKFEALSYTVEEVRKEARQAAAIGLAVSNLRYYDIPGSLSLSFGTGIWRSQSAFAIGAGYTSEDGNIRSNLSITSSGGQWGVGAGITLRLK